MGGGGLGRRDSQKADVYSRSANTKGQGKNSKPVGSCRPCLFSAEPIGHPLLTVGKARPTVGGTTGAGFVLLGKKE